jgi:hypothetical protein
LQERVRRQMQLRRTRRQRRRLDPQEERELGRRMTMCKWRVEWRVL